jgi:hypothetical protein
LARALLAVLLVAMAVSGLIFVGGLQLALATNVSSIIASDTTWTKANSPYNLVGNVLVNNGVTLTIEPGVTVNLNSYYIMVNGTLTARGTSDDQIRFNGGSITFNSNSVSWNEQTGSGCIIENAILTGTVLSSSNTVKINLDTIDTGFTVSSSTIVSNNNIKGDVNGGIITSNTIVGGVTSATILNNVITGNVGCTGVTSNNFIRGGINVNGNCLVSNNTITGGLASSGSDYSGDAIFMGSPYVYGGGFPKIENNLITNSTVGIDISVLIRDWFVANIPLIQDNQITQNGVGIRYSIVTQESYGTAPPTTIQNNTITKNGVGIEFVGSTQEYQIVNNNIQDNTNYNIYLQNTPNDVNVTYNWWGTADSQTISQTIYDYNKDFNLGKVNFSPFLTASNPQAMPTTNPPVLDTTTPTATPTEIPVQTPSSTPTPTPSTSHNPTTAPQTPAGTGTQVIAQDWPYIVIIVLVAVIVVMAAVVFRGRKRSIQNTNVSV